MATAKSLAPKPVPFEERLRKLYRPGIVFYQLELDMYPHDQWPRYWRYPTTGGPPGGRMSFKAALRRRGIRIWEEQGRLVCRGNLP